MTFPGAVTRAFDAGRAAWPGLRLELAAFARWIEERGIVAEALETRPEELFLVAACGGQVPGSIAAFEGRYFPPLAGGVGQVKLSADECDELRQQLRVRLFAGPKAKVGDFRGSGHLGAWVHIMAVRLALRLREGAPPVEAREGTILAQLVSDDASPDQFAAKARYSAVFQQALEGTFARLEPRQKTLLRMHFVDNLSIDEVGDVFHVHRATVARWLVAIRKHVLEEICRRVALDLPASVSEARSLVDLVRSDVRLSLVRVLGNEGGKPWNE